MVQIMPQPWKHPRSGVYYFRKVVPAPLRAALKRTEFRISLGTKNVPFKDASDIKASFPEQWRILPGCMTVKDKPCVAIRWWDATGNKAPERL